jgi:hypothetical protein
MVNDRVVFTTLLAAVGIVAFGAMAFAIVIIATDDFCIGVTS